VGQGFLTLALIESLLNDGCVSQSRLMLQCLDIRLVVFTGDHVFRGNWRRRISRRLRDIRRGIRRCVICYTYVHTEARHSANGR
jgi:hypothetical protein